jgi:GNAT superfamily N-acetyltransferase
VTTAPPFSGGNQECPRDAAATLPGTACDLSRLLGLVAVKIAVVTEADLEDLLPLMRGYCDFYGMAPSDEALLGLARSLLANPDHEGFQLIARNDNGRAVGFATVYWSWSTLSAARTAIMNDLFVHPDARGTGLAEALIEECRVRSGRGGAVSLGWQTAKDNIRAQKVYERVGGTRAEWVDYSLDTSPPG